MISLANNTLFSPVDFTVHWRVVLHRPRHPVHIIYNFVSTHSYPLDQFISHSIRYISLFNACCTPLLSPLSLSGVLFFLSFLYTIDFCAILVIGKLLELWYFAFAHQIYLHLHKFGQPASYTHYYCGKFISVLFNGNFCFWFFFCFACPVCSDALLSLDQLLSFPWVF